MRFCRRNFPSKTDESHEAVEKAVRIARLACAGPTTQLIGADGRPFHRSLAINLRDRQESQRAGQPDPA